MYENLSCKTYSKDCLLKSKREDRIYNCQDSSDRIICQSKKPVFNYLPCTKDIWLERRYKYNE